MTLANPTDDADHQTHDDHDVRHVTLRIDDLGDDGYRVSEPGVSIDATGDTRAEAVAAYAKKACDSDE
jgi:hypothetical protein